MTMIDVSKEEARLMFNAILVGLKGSAPLKHDSKMGNELITKLVRSLDMGA